MSSNLNALNQEFTQRLQQEIDQLRTSEAAMLEQLPEGLHDEILSQMALKRIPEDVLGRFIVEGFRAFGIDAPDDLEDMLLRGTEDD